MLTVYNCSNNEVLIITQMSVMFCIILLKDVTNIHFKLKETVSVNHTQHTDNTSNTTG